ncbi:unnamed protein product, partial [Mesorhabditis belari]|uniref:Cytoplasmic polyadenylation element-binding protein 1 n=1 Tax=Mesorhabditis belari TaxID=2138241 RepID=A0AAF3J9C1_9BILA
MHHHYLLRITFINQAGLSQIVCHLPSLALVERSPDGGYIIPQLYDEGYGSNKTSPAKDMQAVRKCWPESPTFVPRHEELPMGPMLKSHYGFNAFNQVQLNEGPIMDHQRASFNNHYYALLGGGDSLSPQMPIPCGAEIYARKVFIGGLPIDVKEADIYNTFRHFGKMIIDWPRRSEKETVAAATSARTMSGYVFLVYESEASVQMLVNKCYKDNDKLFLLVSSLTMRNKPVQVRPWKLSDTDYIVDKNAKMWARRTVFIGGLPRPTRACDLAAAIEDLYGHVAYVGIDIDPELKYPKGAARVVFFTSESLVAAISGKYVHIPHSEVQKRLEIKPYVMDEQMCDECEGRRCAGRYAPYFCGDFDCMQYFCEICWDMVHTDEDHKFDHKPLVRCGEQTKQLARPPHHGPQHGAARNGSVGHHSLRSRHGHYF